MRLYRYTSVLSCFPGLQVFSLYYNLVEGGREEERKGVENNIIPLTLKAIPKSSRFTCNQAYGSRNPCRSNRSKVLSGESESGRISDLSVRIDTAQNIRG